MELQYLPYWSLPIRIRMPALQAQDMPAVRLQVLGEPQCPLQTCSCESCVRRLQAHCRRIHDVQCQMCFKQDFFERCKFRMLTRWVQVGCKAQIGGIVLANPNPWAPLPISCPSSPTSQIRSNSRHVFLGSHQRRLFFFVSSALSHRVYLILAWRSGGFSPSVSGSSGSNFPYCPLLSHQASISLLDE